MRKCVIILPDNPEKLLEEEGRKLVMEVSAVKNLLKEMHFVLFYDPENFARFSQQLEDWGKYIEQAMLNLRLSLSKTAISISQNPIIDSDALYFKWNLFVGGHGQAIKVDDSVYKFAIEATRNPNVSIAIIFFPTSSNDTKKIVGFKDSDLTDELPDKFSHLPIFNKSDYLAQWFKESFSPQFTLEDSARFEATSLTYHGARVYKESETMRFWYLDNFHKSHYEVFNSGGQHLGEADLDGHLDENKKDKSKKFKF